MKNKNQSVVIKWIVMLALFCGFVVFLIFSGRGTTPVEEERSTASVLETSVEEEFTSAPPATDQAEQVTEEAGSETTWSLPEKETRTISYEELETEDPQEIMTTSSLIEDGTIRNGELQIDVSAVEKDLRKGELYSLADTIKRYLAEKTGENISGKAELISCTTKETANGKTMTVVFRFGKTMYEAKKDLTNNTSEFEIKKKK